MALKILIVDDEKEIRKFLLAGLSSDEFSLIEAESAGEGVQFAATYNPDIILLDLGLPDFDGLEVIRRIREWSRTPIIILSARGEDASKIKALDLGADDYLTKPFSVDELRARIRAHMRRISESESAPAPVVTFGAIEVDLAKRLVKRAGTEVHLTPLEFDLLAFLVRNQNKVVSHRVLLTKVWGPAYADQTQYLRVFMANLRQKLEENSADPKYLRTEPGVGYRLVIE